MLEVLVAILISTGSISNKQAANITSEQQAVAVAKQNNVDVDKIIWEMNEGN